MKTLNLTIILIIAMTAFSVIMLMPTQYENGGGNYRALEEIMISNRTDEANATNISFTQDGAGNLYVVWDELELGIYKIQMTASWDGGITWTGSTRDIIVGGGEYDARQPSIVGGPNKGELYLAWSEFSSLTGNNEIFFHNSSDGGATWTVAKQITVSSTSGKYFTNPMLALTPEGTLYGVWLGFDPNHTYSRGYYREVYFGYSLDGGATWSSVETPIIVSDVTIDSNASAPFILVNSTGAIYVFWTKYIPLYNSTEVFVSISADGGRTWRYMEISYLDKGTKAANVTAAEYNGYVYAFWEQSVVVNGVSGVEIAYSYFDSAVWSGTRGDTFISYFDAHPARNPTAAVYKNLTVMWSEYDENTLFDQIFISETIDGTLWTGAKGDIVYTTGKRDHWTPKNLYLLGDLKVVWRSYVDPYLKQRGSVEVFTLANILVPEFDIQTLGLLVAVIIPAISLRRVRLRRSAKR